MSQEKLQRSGGDRATGIEAMDGPPPEVATVETTVGHLLRQMPAVIWAVDPDLRFTLSEGGGLTALDTEPGASVGRSLFEYFGTEDPGFPPIAAHRRALQGHPATFELEWAGRTFHSGVEPLRDGEGTIVGVVGFAIDITDRKLAEGELRQAESKYRALVEQLPAVVYLGEYGEEGDWLYVSPQIEHVLGYTPEEWLAHPHPMASFTHPEDLPGVRAEEARSQRAGDPYRAECRMRTKDGRWVWILDEAAAVRDQSGTPFLMQGVMFDITEQKQAEDELRRTVEALRRTDDARRELLARLVAAREEEHRQIAADVHDGPVQKMVALGLRLEMLGRRLREPEDVEAVAELSRTVEGTTRELRHLLFQLVPPELETGGLGVALRALLHDLAEGSGIDVHLEDHLGAEPDEPARTVCFRIAQEALRNVGKHARASRVEVLLGGSPDEVHVRVKDDGVGFDPEAVTQPGHFGLSGMRERAELAGGTFHVDSAPGAGTTVEFWIPLPDVPPHSPNSRQTLRASSSVS